MSICQIECFVYTIFPANLSSIFFSTHYGFVVYLDPVARGHSGWPVSTITDGLPDIENVTDALRNGPYGQCVYESPNDVCDNQVSTF